MFDLYFQLSSTNLTGRSSGFLKRAAIPSSREAVTGGNESDPSRSRTAEASPSTMQRFSSGQRSSPVGSSDAKQQSSGRITSIKNYESTLKGIESLHFDDERVH